MNGFDIFWSLATQHFIPTFAVLLLAIAITYFRKGQPITSAMYLSFGGVLGAAEAASIYYTHKTVSQNRWFIGGTDPETDMFLIFLELSLLLVIVIHLGKITIDRFRKR